MKSALSSVLIAAALSAAAPAAAEVVAPSAGDIKRAADAFDRGREALRAEEYVEAAEHFEAADASAPSELALRFAILSRKEAGQLARAASLAALARERYPDDAELEELASSVLDEAVASLHKLDVSCDEPCELVLDDKIVHGQRRKARVLFLDLGPHRLRASWSDDRSATETLEAVAGGASFVNFFIPEQPPAPRNTVAAVDSDATASSPRTGGWSPVVFWSGVGVTVAGAAASTFLGLRAINDPGRDRVRRACEAYEGSDRTACPEYQRGLRHELQANVAIAATSAVGVLTVITGLFLTDWSHDDPARDAVRKPSVKSRGVEAAGHGLTVQPWFGVGETTTIGATGTF
jgi:hypothetical protein